MQQILNHNITKIKTPHGHAGFYEKFQNSPINSKTNENQSKNQI